MAAQPLRRRSSGRLPSSSDAQGNLYIADTFNHAVRRLAPDGTMTTVAGTGTSGFAGDGGAAASARFDQPYRVAVDDAGALYISDRGNFRVRRVDTHGVIDTVAGDGHQGSSGDGGPADRARFAYLARISADSDGLLIADQANSRVRRVNLA